MEQYGLPEQLRLNRPLHAILIKEAGDNIHKMWDLVISMAVNLVHSYRTMKLYDEDAIQLTLEALECKLRVWYVFHAGKEYPLFKRYYGNIDYMSIMARDVARIFGHKV